MTNPLFFLYRRKSIAICLLLTLVVVPLTAFAAIDIQKHDPDCPLKIISYNPFTEKRLHNHKCIVDKVEEVFQVVNNLNTDIIQKHTLIHNFESDDDVQDLMVDRIPEDQQGTLEQLTCVVENASSWAEGESITVIVKIITDEAEIECLIEDATEPSSNFVDDFNGEQTVFVNGGSEIQVTCTSSTEESQGCRVSYDPWIDLQKAPEEGEQE